MRLSPLAAPLSLLLQQTMATHQADIMALIRDILIQQLNDPRCEYGWVMCMGCG